MNTASYQYTCVVCGKAIAQGEDAMASMDGTIKEDGGFQATWAGGPRVRHANPCTDQVEGSPEPHSIRTDSAEARGQ